MFTKTTFALAIILGALSTVSTVSFAQNFGAYSSAYGGALAAKNHEVYDNRGKYVGSDPDANVRFDMRRDSQRGQY
jgi:hypothetical protein